MRSRLALVVALVALASIGCYHDKYNMIGKNREDYVEPPHEPRFDEPPKEAYRAPAKKKEQETLLNKGGGPGGNGGGGLGGNLGGF